MISFIISIVALAIMLIALVFFARYEHWLESLPSFFYQTIIFLLFSTIVIYVYLYKVNKPEFFVQLYLLTMAIKLLGYGAYVYFMITGDINNAFPNVVFFLIAYFLFTALEIIFLYLKNSVNHSG